MSDALERVLAAIRNRYPAAMIEPQEFDSGAELLDVRYADHMFVMERYPSAFFSSYEVKDETPFGSGYRPRFESEEEAIRAILALLAGTGRDRTSEQAA